jgi:hypothetical protein
MAAEALGAPQWISRRYRRFPAPKRMGMRLVQTMEPFPVGAWPPLGREVEQSSIRRLLLLNMQLLEEQPA